jgi:2-polyprenyl-3-methyl-5-hydroxy-6-metoxy-1,4-benzoquinol methylase
VLRSPRLDGPLVRCRGCGLVYVGHRDSDFTFSSSDIERTERLAQRVDELGIVDPGIEEAERRWREAAEEQRLADLQRFLPAGSLLDVGCSTGGFLTLAQGSYRACGVEPDPGTSEQARRRGLDVRTGTLADVTAPEGGFDAITMFHVIEHADSPSALLDRVQLLLRPGGVVMIETPTIDCLWFRLAKRSWRQLIPDHYFFFSRATLARLLQRIGLEPVAYTKVGRRVSLRFLADRMRRSGIPGATATGRVLQRAGLADRTIYVNPGDIMRVTAVATRCRAAP